MKDGNYYKACDDYASYAEQFVKQARNGKPVDVNNTVKNNPQSIFTALIIGLIVALILTFSVKKGYKPVGFNRSAANYLVDGSLNIRGSYDNFLYSNVTSRKIESNSSSGGSSTHTGSSGTSHGGGGRSF